MSEWKPTDTDLPPGHYEVHDGPELPGDWFKHPKDPWVQSVAPADCLPDVKNLIHNHGYRFARPIAKVKVKTSPIPPPGLPPIPETHEYFEGGPVLACDMVDDGWLFYSTTVCPEDGWCDPGWVHELFSFPMNEDDGSWYAIRPKTSGAGAEKSAADMRKHQSESEPSVSRPAPEPTLAEKFKKEVSDRVIESGFREVSFENGCFAAEFQHGLCAYSFTTALYLITNTDEAQLETTRLIDLAKKFKAAVEGMNDGK